MTNFLTRLRLIFIPFVLVAAGFIAVYSLLDYVFVIRMEIPVSEDMVEFWLPFVLPWIPVLILLNPRIRLLSLNQKKNIPALYCFVAVAAIMIPTLMAQQYLKTATGTLTSLNRISEIDKTPLTKYYELKHFAIDTNNISVFERNEVSGKNNESLTFYLDIASPIRDTSMVTGNPMPLGWLCFEFNRGISNDVSDERKQQVYHEFAVKTAIDFKNEKFNDFVYLDRIPASDRRKGYVNAIKKSYGNLLPARPLIFEAVNQPFEARNGNKLAWIFITSGIGALVWLIIIFIPKLNPEAVEQLPGNGVKMYLGMVYTSMGVFKPASNFQVTAIIILINILVFVAMVCAGLGFTSFETRDLVNLGANFGPLTKDGQWWRLLTSCFVHAGLMHLLVNMYGLFFAAVFLEPALGKLRFGLAYVICSIAASITSMLWHPDTVSVGASGAIFGLYGVLTVLLITKKLAAKNLKSLLLYSLVFIVINLLNGLRGGIDNAAHIGGLATGFVIGLIYAFTLYFPESDTKPDDEPEITEHAATPE